MRGIFDPPEPLDDEGSHGRSCRCVDCYGDFSGGDDDE